MKIKMIITSIGLVIIILFAYVKEYISKTESIDKDATLMNTVQETDSDKDVVEEEDGVETIETSDYTIVLRGAARPKDTDITVKEASQIAYDYLKDDISLTKDDLTVTMIFLDKTPFSPSVWSATIPTNETKQSNLTIDAQTKEIISGCERDR